LASDEGGGGWIEKYETRHILYFYMGKKKK